jgi:hypothetical protein
MEIEVKKLFLDQGFKYHFIAYVIVNAILIAVNLMNPSHLWFFWPLLGWGIGIAAHGYSVWKGRTPPKRGLPRMSR